ncbi:hypothetical protein ASPWEDRAFT_41551 [Aspergillus wentii DTO 134E9]|uniref:PEBP-like protein n=1 Tax=Aspergillus wentii DTO 134E9 TaxID=1073089 RepID=A0A1L9RFP7_ASPWE|nr:uncharacterized protein ASPWEDRAFT_41551 [Aspergillus wentii DTO 134E9]KAI9925462.1 hypothetical protein MW887_005843 [Aspergillus wentii]OJJ33698.1 hypothetical protein ASPWEDRAFT_41551 [Aspergillus wentii DTO 134E9]
MTYAIFALGLFLLLSTVNAQDGRLFFQGPAFSQFPVATFDVDCPEIGPSGSNLTIENSRDGTGCFPALGWSPSSPGTAKYLIISEDPDAPLPKSIIHGLYYAIPPEFTGITEESLLFDGIPYTVRAGFKYGQNRGGSVYLAPQPMVGHGPHRYFFEVIALNQTIDQANLSPAATVEEIAREIEGKVAGWGAWMGVLERT